MMKVIFTWAIDSGARRYGGEGLAWRIGITVCCLVGLLLPRYCVGCDETMMGHWLYWMSHANVFHLACNLWCLWLIRIPLRWMAAMMLSVACGYLPCPTWDWGAMGFVDMDTCGLSGFLLCALGMAWGETGEIKKAMKVLVMPVIVFSLLPKMNMALHAWCMIGGLGMGWMRMMARRTLALRKRGG